MSGAASRLPPGFEMLEPFVDAWAIAGTRERAERRVASAAAERIAFFNAVKDILPAGLAYLDRKPLAAFDESETRLMNLLLSCAHVSLAVELQGDAEPHHAEAAHHLRITRAPANQRTPK
ncbi:MAG TPA: hypothetical protein VMB71_03055 [Acetobacteraceae bacterium]|nr:hypothetical protein [Acetobacteraceae bacterium]